jgi:hypothetical protein
MRSNIWCDRWKRKYFGFAWGSERGSSLFCSHWCCCCLSQITVLTVSSSCFYQQPNQNTEVAPLNTDGAFYEHWKGASGAVVRRNENGDLIRGSARWYGNCLDAWHGGLSLSRRTGVDATGGCPAGMAGNWLSGAFEAVVSGWETTL